MEGLDKERNMFSWMKEWLKVLTSQSKIFCLWVKSSSRSRASYFLPVEIKSASIRLS